MTVLEIVLASIVAVGVAFVVGRLLFRFDTKVEDQRRNASRLAGILSALGLRKLPEFLLDYSVGDYSGMAEKIGELVRLFLEGEGAVVKEFSQVFDSLLAAKLSTEDGRAYIAAKLADATLSGDPTVVTDAPKATVL
jgi:hypothetical protein